MRSPSHIRISVLLGGVFLSRLVFASIIWRVSGPQGFFMPDSPGYLTLAQSLLHGSFSNDGIPNILRTPGYPLLLALGVALQHPVGIAVFENLLLAVFSAWLIWRIVASFSEGSQAPTWAVLLYCFEPVGFLYSLKVLSETLFSAQLLLFIWLVVGFLRQPSHSKLVLAAMALGWTTYTRPVTLYLGVWLIPVFLFFPIALPLIQRGFRAILFLLVFASTLAPWTFRNAKVADYPGFSSIGDVGLYFYAAASVQAKLEHKGFAQAQQEMGWGDDQHYFQAHPGQIKWSQGQIVRFMRAESERIISQHLPSFLLLHARGFVILLFDTVATSILGAVHLYPEGSGLLTRTVDQGFYRGMMWLIRQYPVVGLAFIFLGIQLLLYYAFAVLGLRQLPFAVGCFFALVVLYFVLVSGGPIANGRYRGPIMPLVCISAGVAIASASRKSRLTDDPMGARPPRPRSV